jgi:hypothetical protein
MNAHDPRGVPVWDSRDGSGRKTVCEYFTDVLCLCCVHVGARPGLRHTVIFSARKQSFIAHTAGSFRLRRRALKGPICIDVALKNGDP